MASESKAIRDSGQRQTFATGAVRDVADGKPMLELISPILLRRLGDWLTKGAKKYAARNWEKGIPMDRSMGSLLRHLNQHREGLRDEDHLAAVACNIMFLIHTEEMVERGLLPPELDDLPRYTQPPEQGPEFGEDPWITLASGKQFHFFGDDSDEIDIEDIAHSLALQCRYKGHCTRFFSVAEHSVVVARLMPPDLAVFGLLHDAAEFVLGDAPSPIKSHLGRFAAIEADIMFRVYDALGVDLPDQEATEAVKTADRIALAAEARALFVNGDRGWCCEKVCVPPTVQIRCLSPEQAEAAFLAEHQKIEAAT